MYHVIIIIIDLVFCSLQAAINEIGEG